MKTESTSIENLIELFFKGKTSNQEERELWLYFSGENIPEHLKQYREFFIYYSHDFMTELGTTKQLLMKNTKKRGGARAMMITASAVAAILVFVIIIPLVRSSGDCFDSYEGSYMIANGERIYDVELIQRQEKEIREMASLREKEYREIYAQSESRENELRDIMMIKDNKSNQ